MNNELKAVLDNIKNDLSNLKQRILDFKGEGNLMGFLTQASKETMADSIENGIVDYLKDTLNIKKTTSYKKTKKIKKKFFDLPLEYTTEFDNLIKQLRTLLHSVSENNQNGKVNSQKLLKKLNTISRAKKLETRVDRAITAISTLIHMNLVYNGALKKPIRRKPAKGKSQSTSFSVQKLSKLLLRQEDEFLDFKRSYLNEEGKLGKLQKREIAKDVSSFANRKGGVIILGVEDDGSPVGIHSKEPDRETIRQILSKRVNPVIPNVKLHDRKYKEKDLRIIEIAESDIKPHEIEYDGKKKAYVRDGEQSREATPLEIVEMYRSNSQSSKNRRIENQPKNKIPRSINQKHFKPEIVDISKSVRERQLVMKLEEKITRIKTGESAKPYKLNSDGKIVILIQSTNQSDDAIIDLDDISHKYNYLPLYIEGKSKNSLRPSNDKIVSAEAILFRCYNSEYYDTDNKVTSAYQKIFENGTFEYVNNWVFRDYGMSIQDPSVKLGKLILLERFIDLLKVQLFQMFDFISKIGVKGPFAIKISLLDIQDSIIVPYDTTWLISDIKLNRVSNYTKEDFHFKIVMATKLDIDEKSFRQEIELILIPQLKRFWRECGLTWQQWSSNYNKPIF